MNKSQIIVILTVFFLLEPCGHVWCSDRYTISMLPRYAPEEIIKRIKPLATYISKYANIRVDPVVSRDFDNYRSRLRRGDILIGYENPYIYTLVSNEHEVIAKAVKGQSGDKFRGIIITRSDSDIVDINDLKGKTISIVSKTSAGGFLSQQATLQKFGFDMNDMILTEALDNKQENVLLAVYYGDVDAGFIRESALHVADNYLASSQIKVIKRTEWLPNWALSVNKKIPANIKSLIRNAVLKLEEGNIVLKALKIKRFEKVQDSDYDVIRLTVGLPIPQR